jgi:hypothetical protein
MRVALVCPYSCTVPGGVQSHVAWPPAAAPYDWSRVASRIVSLYEQALAT